MKSLNILYSAILLVFFFSSCQKEVPYPEQKPEKLVVFSFIKPSDNKIIVSVSRSKPAFGSNRGKPQEIQDAVVSISEGNGGAAKIIAWNVDTKQYELDKSEFSIEVGKIYELKVSANGQSVSAKTSIPQDVKGPKFSLVGKQIGTDKLNSDIPDKYNYRFTVPYDGLTNGGYFHFYPMIAFSYTWDPNKNEEFKYGKDYLLANGQTNLKDFDKVLTLERENHDNINKPISRHIGLFISCSEEYYLFQRTAPANLETAGTPDFIRPQVDNIYSNINGGYGVFAGYNETKVEINQ